MLEKGERKKNDEKVVTREEKKTKDEKSN